MVFVIASGRERGGKMLVSRDPFARQELHRETVPALGSTCSWCGQVRETKRGNMLYRYYIEKDGRARKNYISGLFCSIGCMRDYNR